MTKGVFETRLPGLPPPKRGKVRDIYEIDEALLLVATDRISAFDVVLPDPVPGKGIVLTRISRFWFDFTAPIVPNHMITCRTEEFPDVFSSYADILAERSMLVEKTAPLPVECIVRGYLSGSGWKEYQKTGAVCGISLPPGLRESDKLPEPVFTPSTKAEAGAHDENISFDRVVNDLGEETARRLRETSLALYKTAADYAESKGIIVADTKFEFGIKQGRLVLIDEALTPDSSRFWPLADYRPGGPQKSFDKQYVRDRLEEIGWNKTPPAPKLGDAVIQKTREKYLDALHRLTGDRYER